MTRTPKKSLVRRRQVGKIDVPTAPSRWLIMPLLLLVALCCVTVYVFLYARLTAITMVDVVGAQRVSTEEIRTLVHEDLTGVGYLGIPRNNLIMFDASTAAARIREVAPQIEDVTIQKHFPHAVTVTVKEYDTIPIVCVRDVRPETCARVDMGGVRQTDHVDFQSPLLRANNVLILVVQEDVPQQDDIISPTVVAHAITLATEMPYTLGVQPQQPFRAQAVQSYDFDILTDEGWVLRVDLTQDTVAMLARVEKVLTKTDVHDNRRDLEYIDARFGEKIFYRLHAADAEKDVREDLDTAQKTPEAEIDERALHD